MFLKLEEVAEERQPVVRCDGVNRVSVLPVATSALEGSCFWRDSPEMQGAGDVWACIVMKRFTLILLLVSPVSQLVHPISTVCCLLFLMLVESV